MVVEAVNQYIYLAEDEARGLLKIGISANPQQRMLTMRLPSGEIVRPKLLGSFIGTADDERQLHHRFARFRVLGNEWFSREAEILGFISSRFTPLPDICNSGAVVYCRLPDNLYSRIVMAAHLKDLKLVAIVSQALELWLKENHG